MRHVLVVLVLGVAAATAVATDLTTVTPSEKIIGGSVSSVSKYPYIVSILKHYGWWWWSGYEIACAGIIINYRTVLTVARCVIGDPEASNWRIRAGSSYHSTGGSVHSVSAVMWHPDYKSLDSDLAIIRPKYSIIYSDVIQPATIAGSDYDIPDGTFFTAAGWGPVTPQETTVNALHEVEVLLVNTTVCRNRYALNGYTVTDNMVCVGRLSGNGPCSSRGDYGGPLIRNGVVVGIYSWQSVCDTSFYPGVYTYLSRFALWIQSNS